jgi:hypothetical protein
LAVVIIKKSCYIIYIYIYVLDKLYTIMVMDLDSTPKIKENSPAGF